MVEAKTVSPDDVWVEGWGPHAQIAPTEIRGLLGTLNQFMICVGILGALVAGLPLAQNPTW